MKSEITLEVCSRSDERYLSYRNRHYIPNRGCHGQQIHFLIYYKGEQVGIISGASSVYAIKQKRYLPAIINNVVFRLEHHEKNLGTRILSKFRKVSALLWKRLYGVDVIGFETFVIENDRRKGALYKADNWAYLGETKGNTKTHDVSSKSAGLTTTHKRRATEIKLIFGIKTKNKIPTSDYVSSWRASTPEEKKRAKDIVKFRKELLGKTF